MTKTILKRNKSYIEGTLVKKIEGRKNLYQVKVGNSKILANPSELFLQDPSFLDNFFLTSESNIEKEILKKEIWKDEGNVAFENYTTRTYGNHTYVFGRVCGILLQTLNFGTYFTLLYRNGSNHFVPGITVIEASWFDDFIKTFNIAKDVVLNQPNEEEEK